jgi:hypothetical protein
VKSATGGTPSAVTFQEMAIRSAIITAIPFSDFEIICNYCFPSFMFFGGKIILNNPSDF